MREYIEGFLGRKKRSVFDVRGFALSVLEFELGLVNWWSLELVSRTVGV